MNKFIQEIAFECVVYEIAAIVTRSECVIQLNFSWFIDAIGK